MIKLRNHLYPCHLYHLFGQVAFRQLGTYRQFATTPVLHQKFTRSWIDLSRSLSKFRKQQERLERSEEERPDTLGKTDISKSGLGSVEGSVEDTNRDRSRSSRNRNNSSDSDSDRRYSAQEREISDKRFRLRFNKGKVFALRGDTKYPMPKVQTGYYAVKRGRVPGVYSTWDECEAQTKGFGGASFKKFRTLEEAQGFVNNATPGATADSANDSKVGTVHPNSVGSNHKNVHKNGDNKGVEAVVMIERWSQGLESQQSRKHDDNPQEADIVYSDGACRGNGKVGSTAGIGVWWGSNDPRNLHERCPGVQTNNRAELIAIVRALETAPFPSHSDKNPNQNDSKFQHYKNPEKAASIDKPRKLVIRTDSKYSISCIEIWRFSWEQRNWKTTDGEPVKNEGVIRYILALLRRRAKNRQVIKFEHVRGHSGEIGNEGADRLAVAGAYLPVVAERDWDRLRLSLEESEEEEGSSDVDKKLLENQLEFEIEDDDLLSPEELNELEQTQDF